MEISGKIIMALPERSGVSQRTGTEWKLATYVLETLEQYPKKMVFEVFGSDRVAQMNIQVGQMLTVSFDVDAHEYNGRWYNSIRAWRVQPYDPSAPVAAPAQGIPVPPAMAAPQQGAPAPAAAPATAPAAAPAPTAAPADTPFDGGATDDLPF